MLNNHFTIDDFDEKDFSNPISLIDAMQKLSAHLEDFETSVLENNFLSVSDIQNQYGLSVDCIRSSLLAGTLSPASMILYFAKEDVERIAAESKNLNPLMVAFEKELSKMVMNYSYKPLLLLALLSQSGYSASMDEIIDFYFEFYRNREADNLPMEKEDSCFVRHPNNRIAARKTILRYPVTVLAKKSFVVYDKDNDSVSLNPLLVNGNNHFCAEYVQSQCRGLLKKYYESI